MDNKPLRRCRLLGFLLLGLSLTFAVPVTAQEEPTLSAAQRDSVTRELIRALPRRYVFEDQGREAADHIARRLAAGAYDDLSDPRAFAEALTEDLRQQTGDRHFSVTLLPPEGFPEPDHEPPPGAVHHGFRKLEILAGNVGYVRLDGFAPPSAAGEVAVAAMRFLSQTDALIFDLRYNGGGDPAMVQLLSSYLLPSGVHLNSLIWRAEEGESESQFWTLPFVPGTRRPDVPVYVLTSGRTFSGAEEFANNLRELERATLVGETTGGGANPGGMVELGEGFAVFLPSGRALNPISGGNWEGTGVEPHVPVPAEEALDRALLLALDGLVETAPPGRLEDLRLARVVTAARVDPHALSPQDMDRLAGTYGVRSMWVEDGRLLYRYEDRPAMAVTAADPDRLVLEGLDEVYIEVERGADDLPVALRLIFADGRRVRAERGAGPAAGG